MTVAVDDPASSPKALASTEALHRLAALGGATCLPQGHGLALSDRPNRRVVN